MKPKTRKENFLARIAKDDDAVEIDPRTREERFLNDIANGESTIEPKTREEAYLKAVAAAPAEPPEMVDVVVQNARASGNISINAIEVVDNKLQVVTKFIKSGSTVSMKQPSSGNSALWLVVLANTSTAQGVMTTTTPGVTCNELGGFLGSTGKSFYNVFSILLQASYVPGTSVSLVFND